MGISTNGLTKLWLVSMTINCPTICHISLSQKVNLTNVLHEISVEKQISQTQNGNVITLQEEL